MFRRAADLRHSLLAGEDAGRLDALWRLLARDVTSHLSHEERLLENAEYPALDWHEHQHRTARARLAAVERSIRNGQRPLIFEAIEAFARWLRDHTSVADRMAGSYLRNHERANSA